MRGLTTLKPARCVGFDEAYNEVVLFLWQRVQIGLILRLLFFPSLKNLFVARCVGFLTSDQIFFTFEEGIHLLLVLFELLLRLAGLALGDGQNLIESVGRIGRGRVFGLRQKWADRKTNGKGDDGLLHG